MGDVSTGQHYLNSKDNLAIIDFSLYCFVTNGAKARQGEIKNAKIILAVESMLACAYITHLSKLAPDASSFLDTNDQGYTSNERKTKSLR